MPEMRDVRFNLRLVIISLFLLLCSGSRLLAWGQEGHSIIAEIAGIDWNFCRGKFGQKAMETGE